MYRRILAAFAGLAVLILTPARLGGEPATTSTTDVFGTRPPAAASPLTLYPGRPGATIRRRRGTPSSTSTAGDILHVVVHVTPTLLPAGLACVGIAAGDGSVLVPYDRPPPKPPSTTSRTSQPPPVDIDLYLPLGSVRGGLYLACGNSLFKAPVSPELSVVAG